MLCQGWTVVVRRTGLGTTPQKSLCLLQELQAGPTKEASLSLRLSE